MSHSRESGIGCKYQDKQIKEDNIIEPNLVLLLGIMVICHMSYAQLVMLLCVACGRQHKMAWHGMVKGALDPYTARRQQRSQILEANARFLSHDSMRDHSQTVRRLLGEGKPSPRSVTDWACVSCLRQVHCV